MIVILIVAGLGKLENEFFAAKVYFKTGNWVPAKVCFCIRTSQISYTNHHMGNFTLQPIIASILVKYLDF